MSSESVLDRWKSTPEYSADMFLREKAVMECLESLEPRVGSKDSVTSAAAALQVLEVSNDILGEGLGTFAGFLNEIRATQSEALDALHMQAGQLTAWVIAELWQPTHSRFPTDGQLGDETQMRFTQRWRKAVRTSVLSREWVLAPESPDTTNANALPAAQPAALHGSEIDETPATNREKVDHYIEEVWEVARRRITRADIWRSARYKTRTEFERWERNDFRATKSATNRFTKMILSEKPHLK